MGATITALAALAGFAVFMVAFTLVPLIVIVLAGLALFGSALSNRRASQPAPEDDGPFDEEPEAPKTRVTPPQEDEF